MQKFPKGMVTWLEMGKTNHSRFCLEKWQCYTKVFLQFYGKLPGGGGTSLWVRRGCAPVLGSFWPENSGIGVSFYWKISVIGVYFHSEFSGIGD